MIQEKHNAHFPKTAIVIAGPTAVGKTPLAIGLAQYFGTEIISADARQCFKEMRIGTAVPSPEALRTVPHHFIHSHSITENMNAGKFEKLALNQVRVLFKTKNIVIVCGGTGLYIKAFCEGIDPMPPVPPTIQEQVREQYRQKGLGWLQQQMREQDPIGYARIEQQNPQRLMRALAVVKATGRSLKTFQSGQKKKRPFKIIKIGLSLPKDQLWHNIENRTFQMMKQGLLKEVEALYSQRHLNALQTVGYRELFGFLEKKYSMEEAIDKIAAHTRQYAKRQMTWFKKDAEIKWFSPGDKNEIIAHLREHLEMYSNNSNNDQK